MKKMIYPLLFLLCFISAMQDAKASHMMGAEFSWTCVGQDSFIVKLTAYTDCNWQSLANCNIGFKCATTGASITALNITVSTPVDITPVCKTSCTRCQSVSCSFPYGVKRYIMQGLVRLNAAGTCCNVRLHWEECCRTNAITTGAGNANFFIEALMNRCQNPCDNSPVFANPPALMHCVGQDVTYNPGLVDVDLKSNGTPADSFTYEWGHPLNASGNNISYTGQYAYNKSIYFWGFPNDALPFPRGLHLDEQTGTMQFRPMKAEITVMVVKVNEFRNGVKIAELTRDFIAIVITCTSNNPPSITTPNNIKSKTVCGGDSVVFTFSTNDPNTNDTVTISAKNIPKGAVWTHTNGQTKHPTATLVWKTGNIEASSLPYNFYVSATDNACPISAAYAQLYQINVKFKLKGNPVKTNLGCGVYHFDLDTVYNQKLNYLLKIAGKQYSLDYTQNFKFDLPGTYPYILSISYPNACNTISDTGIITTDSFLYASLPADTEVYCGRPVIIKPKVFFSKGQVKYYWSTGDTGSVLNIDLVMQDQTIVLTIQDNTGCIVTDSMKISIRNKPLMFATDTTICSGTSLSITPYTPYHLGKVKYSWNTGDTTRSIKTSRLFKNSFVTLTTQDSAGCVDYHSMIINTINNYEMIPANRWLCSGISTSIKAKTAFTKGHVSYQWSTGDTNQTLMIGPLYKDSLFSLSIIDSAGCTVQNNMFITVLKSPEIVMEQVRNKCRNNFTSIFPTYQTFGIGNFVTEFKWNYAGNPNVLSTQSSISIKQPGSYVFSITDNQGCMATDTITLNNYPAIDTSLAVSGPYLTAAQGLKGYYWFLNNKLVSSGTSNTFKAFEKGWYFAWLFDSWNCSDSTREVYIGLDGINNQLQNNRLKLYPNPTGGKLLLETADLLTADMYIEVFNQFGRLILKEKIIGTGNQKIQEIDISDQPAGIYTVIIRYQNVNFHQLIIKE